MTRLDSITPWSASRLTTDAAVRFKGIIALASLLMGGSFKRRIVEQMQSEFARLKELCEAAVERA